MSNDSGSSIPQNLAKPRVPADRRFGAPIVLNRRGKSAPYIHVSAREQSRSKSYKSRPAGLSDTVGKPDDVVRMNAAAAGLRRRLPGNRLRASWRRMQILSAALYYYSFSMCFWLLNVTRIRPASSEQRDRANAVRLRRIIEWLGGGFIKVGQQLALRSDLLRPVFCDQLEQLFDRHKPFPVAQARAAIKRTAGRDCDQVFRTFEDKPIGSASLACVYRATLFNGDQVAVKVRRPGIEALFADDLAALGSIAWMLELLTLYRRRFFENALQELANIALEETDFRTEARYQELFRKYHLRRKNLKVIAPRVYFSLSGEEVMVTEFIHGFPLQEILLAVETRDENYLEMLRNLSIDPVILAKHLIRSKYYSFHECPFFHGDPHPGNIIVQPHNQLVMIDFGACGVFSERDRQLMLRMNELYSRGDVSGMVDCVLGLAAPLPLSDIDSFKKELLDAWWKGYYGLQSDHAEWWERTSLRLWMALLELFSKYQISMPTHMIRMVRATLLYDTVAARLHPKINVFTEFYAYYREAGRVAQRHYIRYVARHACTGPDPTLFLQVRDAFQLGRDIFYRLQRLVGQSEVGFVAVMDKIYFAIDGAVDLCKSAFWISLVGLTLIGAGRLLHLLPALTLDLSRWSLLMRSVTGMTAALILLNIFSYIRHTFARWRDKDNYNDRVGITV